MAFKERTYPNHTNINFTRDELRLIFGLTRILNHNSPTYVEEMKELIKKELAPSNGPFPEVNALATTAESILYKIGMSEAEASIDAILMGEDVTNTKATSWGKVTNITDKHQRILDLLKNYPGSSRRDIANMLNQPINRICPRVKELLEMSRINVVGTKYDQGTDRYVEVLEVA